LAAMGTWMANDGLAAGYFVAGFFGIGAGALAVGVLRPGRMEVDADRLVITTPFRGSVELPFDHVAAFEPVVTEVATRYGTLKAQGGIGVRFTEAGFEHGADLAGGPGSTHLARKLSDLDAALPVLIPDRYLEHVVDALNDHLDRHHRR
jgi:hypothetical protein